ncbi:MAG: sensor histidine kinase, partial [Deltaproteobacteria bacterium]|nr:sensor histidine kinase [Deltaproteobacteria bacterium]
AGGVVTMGAGREDDRVVLWVHNESAMPKSSQLQVFQRSFSTKGKGRGLGTYSIKLLTERYLNGSASFTSTEAEGTTFQISLPLHLDGSSDASKRNAVTVEE